MSSNKQQKSRRLAARIICLVMAFAMVLGMAIYLIAAISGM